jgi:3-carboxy-cis,cis-muconate cycloisomerase
MPVAELGAALSVSAGFIAKIAVDIELLAQTEVAEVREAADGASSTMPHKRNPVRSMLARACAIQAQAAAGVLLSSLVQEHERAAGAWHAEWGALSDALALTGGAAAAVHGALEGLEIDTERMRANITAETLSEAKRFGIDAKRAEDYLGSADAFTERALQFYRER